MPELSFRADGVEVPARAAAPLLMVNLEISNAAASETIQNIALTCQVQIEATRRRYTPIEQSHLRDLFGEPDRWSRTLTSMLWTHASVNVPAFTERTQVQLPLPCTFDFNVAATKYFHGLEAGDVPLLLLFSGTVFYRGPGGALQVTQIPWDREAKFLLPVRVWHEMMETYYPNSVWLRIPRDLFGRLAQYKADRGLATWESALERLLSADEEQVSS